MRRKTTCDQRVIGIGVMYEFGALLQILGSRFRPSRWKFDYRRADIGTDVEVHGGLSEYLENSS